MQRFESVTLCVNVNLKRWFNDRYWNSRLRAAVGGTGTGPFYELCGHSWCFRWSRYDHRCGRHQDDPWCDCPRGACRHRAPAR